MSKPHALQSFVIHVFWKTKTEQSKIFLTFDTFDQGLRRQDLTNKKKIHRQRQYFMELSLRETLRLVTLLKIMTFLYVETNNPKIEFIMSTVLISALKVFFFKESVKKKQRMIHIFFRTGAPLQKRWQKRTEFGESLFLFLTQLNKNRRASTPPTIEAKPTNQNSVFFGCLQLHQYRP